MKIAFRIECAHCKWGFPWSDNYVNMGWMTLECPHCDRKFYTKISIPVVDIQTQKEEPNCPISNTAVEPPAAYWREG
jgi:hypothetical protein